MGAVAAGMPRAQAYEFAAAAVAGSAQLVLETGRHPGDLKDMVCSPGGTTIEGVRALEEGAFRASVMNAISACVEKAKPSSHRSSRADCVELRSSPGTVRLCRVRARFSLPYYERPIALRKGSPEAEQGALSKCLFAPR